MVHSVLGFRTSIMAEAADSGQTGGRANDRHSTWITRISADDIEDLTLGDLENPYNRYTLLMAEQSTFIKWLQRNRLLLDVMICEKCDSPCILYKRSRCIDGFAWRCKKHHEVSVRKNSFFEKSHLYIQDILNFALEYASGSSLYTSSKISGMTYKSSAVQWATCCRDLYVEYYTTVIAPVKFSGQVEIDESLFGRRTKYHRGAPKGNKVWIIGIVENKTNRLKLIPVQKRDAATLIPIIQENVEVGSKIFTDCWRAYSSLNTLGFRHFTVNHKKNFKCQYTCMTTGEVTTVHTNRIEGAWKHAKDYFKKMNGTTLKNFESHLCAVMWRNWNRANQTGLFVELIQQCYTLTSPVEFTSPYPLFTSWHADPEVLNASSFSRKNTDEENTEDDSKSENEEESTIPVGTGLIDLDEVHPNVTVRRKKRDHSVSGDEEDQEPEVVHGIGLIDFQEVHENVTLRRKKQEVTTALEPGPSFEQFHFEESPMETSFGQSDESPECSAKGQAGHSNKRRAFHFRKSTHQPGCEPKPGTSHMELNFVDSSLETSIAQSGESPECSGEGNAGPSTSRKRGSNKGKSGKSKSKGTRDNHVSHKEEAVENKVKVEECDSDDFQLSCVTYRFNVKKS